MDRRATLVAALAVAFFVSTACGSSASSGGAAKTAPFDQQFIDMMVPHHQGAVEMARIAQQRAQRPEVKGMAEEVVSAQDAEIARMKQWRKAWFGSEETPPMSKMPMVEGMDAGHAGMGGAATMDMAADVEKLRQAGEPFDRAFIDAMIPHHESAIAAATAARSRAQREEIKTLAGEIITAQEREIAQMKEWRRAWYGA
jgi:uncharacterized protein (DUF305 family)